MKRFSIWFSAAGASAALLAVWISFGQSAQPVVPFSGTPAIAAFDGTSRTIAARGADGKYSLFRFSRNPYTLLTSMLEAMNFIAAFSAPPPLSSAGPAGVGLASQVVAGYVDSLTATQFIWAGARGVNSVAAGRFDLPSLAFHTANITISPNPAGVIAADFNRDGKVDFVVAFLGNGNSPGGVAILLNNGSGGYAPPVFYAAGFSPISLAAFDLNGDGIIDLAVADNGSGTTAGSTWVLLGKGDGSFGQATSYPAGANPLTVTIADFTGDQRPDLAVGASDGSVTILQGNQNGTFSLASSFKVTSSASYVAAGDFNADGRMDLAVAVSDGTVSVFLGSGGGAFQFKSAYITGSDPNSLIVTDYNADGKLDIINGTGDARGFGGSLNSGYIDILLGNGDGTFEGAAVYPSGRSSSESAVGDFNGDGKPDVVSVGTGISDRGGTVLLGNGDGTFRAGATFTTSSGNSVDVSDFDRDGKLDFVTNSDIVLGNGDGTFRAPVPLPVTGSFVRVADFNGDKISDVAIVDASSVTILLGKGDGSFQIGQTQSVGVDPAGIAISDFNRDGKPDIAVATGFFNSDPAAVTIFLGKGDGTFQPPSAVFLGQGPYFAIAAADFNGDGNPDLAVPYELINTQSPPLVAILLGNGDGSFRAPINVPVPNNGNPSGVAAADFDGDGKLDLVVPGGSTGVLYLAGNGDGTFQSALPFRGGPAPVRIVAADLNGDRKPDLIITDRGSGGIGSGAVLPLLNSLAAAPPAAPSVSAVGPPSGSGSGQNFTVTFSDPSGAQNFKVVDVLIRDVLDGRSACYVAFVPSTNSLYLVDDAGDAGGPYQGLVLPSSVSIANSQCTIRGSGSSAVISGNNLTLTLAITFSTSFGGNKVVYTSAADQSGANSGWQSLATWNVPGALPNALAAAGMNPARTSSAGPSTYTFTFTDTNGSQDLTIANVLIATAIDGRHACYLAVRPASSSVFLVDDAGDAAGPFQGLQLPSTGSIANSQCTINAAGSSITLSGSMVTVMLSIAFNHSFAGNQLFFLAARNDIGGNSGWQAVGSVTVP